MKKQIFEFFKFGLVGLFGIFIDFSITWVCSYKLEMYYIVANGIGFCVAASSNYLVNSCWTFSANQTIGIKSFSIFLMISSIGLLLNSACVLMFKDFFNLNLYLAKLLAVVIVFNWNFFANAKFTFSEGR